MATPEWKIIRNYDSLRIRIDDDGGWDYFKYTLRDADGDDIETVDYTTDTSYTFEDLEPDTYYIGVISWSDSTTGLGYYDISDPVSTYYFDSWSWTSSNGSATAAQTRAAREAVNNQGPTSEFSYKVWNDLVDFTQELHEYMNDDWYSLYASYSKTRMTSSDKVLTAVRFNSLVYNLTMGVGEDIGVDMVAPGDKVMGNYFTKLARALNDYIDICNGDDWYSY